MKVMYGGAEPTIHPELGLLQPGENEIPERRRDAVERAVAAGLPLILKGGVARIGLEVDTAAGAAKLAALKGELQKAAEAVEPKPPRGHAREKE